MIIVLLSQTYIFHYEKTCRGCLMERYVGVRDYRPEGESEYYNEPVHQGNFVDVENSRSEGRPPLSDAARIARDRYQDQDCTCTRKKCLYAVLGAGLFIGAYFLEGWGLDAYCRSHPEDEYSCPDSGGSNSTMTNITASNMTALHFSPDQLAGPENLTIIDGQFELFMKV